MASLVINENELENWELVNPSDSDSNDDVCSLDSWTSEITLNPQNDIPDLILAVDVTNDVNDDDDDASVTKRYLVGDDEDDDASVTKRYLVGDDDDDGRGDDDVSDDDDYLDDELVPRYLSGKLGRERMRKLGKRGGFAKMNSSKRVPHSFVKAGCVYGKHGLGIKHRY